MNESFFWRLFFVGGVKIRKPDSLNILGEGGKEVL